MSTRAVYTFKDDMGEHHVYKHHDGYPEGAAIAINAALPYAWPLPRFEADEFAAAFVCGNKLTVAYGLISGGGVRLMPSGPIDDVAPGDIEFRYEIFFKRRELWVQAFTTNDGGVTGSLIINCRLVDFAKQAKAWSRKDAA